MIPNPILKVLSSMRAHRVRSLLMGGQACVLYGAAEFSRDIDLVILADEANLARLRKALTALQANPIAVPPFETKYFRKGHAIHFRCQHPEVLRMRVDVMSKLRGVGSFAVYGSAEPPFRSLRAKNMTCYRCLTWFRPKRLSETRTGP